MQTSMHRIALAVAACLLALSGCNESKTESAETSTGADAGETKPEYVIGLIAKSEANAVFEAARQGAEDAAEEIGQARGINIEIDWRTPATEDAQQQARFVETLANTGVDGIAISCSDANILTGAINDAVESGVEVVTFDSDAPDSARFAYYGVNDYDAGKKVMEELAKILDGQGVVAVLAGNQAAANLQARVEGVLDEAKNHPDITIREVYYHPETASDAAAKMQQVQTANPDITGWALVGGWPLYTDNALDGIHETAEVVSMDPLPLPLEYAQKGQVQALVGQPYYGWGYESIRLLIDKLHEGKEPAQVMNYAEFDVVTPENAAEYKENWEKWLGG